MKTLQTNKLVLLFLAVVALVAPAFRAAANVTWTNAAGDLLWSNPANWQENAVPVATDWGFFNDTAGWTNVAGAVNNIVDANTTVVTLTYSSISNSTQAHFHTTRINPGVTLTLDETPPSVNAFLTAGTLTSPGDLSHTTIIGTGGATLAVGNLASPSFNISGSGPGLWINSDGPSAGAQMAVVDMSQLDNFTLAGSYIALGCSGSGSLSENGTLILAKTNFIKTLQPYAARNYAGIMVGAHRGGNQAGASTDRGDLQLGQTNQIWTDTLQVGYIRMNTGTVEFQSSLMGSNPQLVMRGTDGIGRVSRVMIGDQSDLNQSITALEAIPMTGTVDLTGGTVDILVANMNVGRNSALTTTSRFGQGTGTLTFTGGTIDTTTLNIGSQAANNRGTATGTVNVRSNASLIVGTMTMGQDLGSASGTGTGTLNIDFGGSVTVTNTITENTALGTSTINIGNGTLNSGDAVRVDNLNLTNAQLTLTIGPSINDANPACSVSSLNLATTNKFSVQGTGVTLGRYPLIKYTGVIGGGGFATVGLGSGPFRTQGYLSNNIANSSIDLVITNITPIKWNGNVNGDWDIAITTNWIDTLNSSATTYQESVSPPTLPSLFDDTASGTKTVTLTTNLAPSSVAVNNSGAPYIFYGDGRITGAGSITKSGSGTLVLTNAGVNDFTGGVFVNGGTVQLGLAADRLPTNGTVTLANVSGALLDLGGQDQMLGAIAGGGASGGSVSLGANNLAVMGTATHIGNITGTGAIIKINGGNQSLGGASTYSGGTFVTAGTVSVVNTTGNGAGLGPVDIAASSIFSVGNGGAGGSIATTGFITNNGTLLFNSSDDNTVNASIEGSGVLFKNNTNTVTLTAPSTYSGATIITNGALRIINSDALGDIGGMTTIGNIQPSCRLELMGNITVAESIEPAMKAYSFGDMPAIANLSGTNTLSGTLTLYQGGSYWSFRSDAGSKLIISGTIDNQATTGVGRVLRLYGDGDGEISTPITAGLGTSVTYVEKHGTGTWTLTGSHFYTGKTYAWGGSLIVNGDITSTDEVIVGNPYFDTPWQPGGVPALLGGTGTINGPVTVTNNCFLSPGHPIGSIGTMTINNTLATLGTNIFDVNTDTLEHDLITGLTSVTFGGTLALVPSGGLTALTNGASAQLFSAASYSGAFDAIVPATPGVPGLFWNIGLLNASGVLKIVDSTFTTPTNVVASLTGNTLTLSWPESHTGWRLEGQTNSVNVGINNSWFPVPGSAGTNQVSMEIDPANGAVFYRMVYP